MLKKLHPMTVIEACWTFTETKQWMSARFSSGDSDVKDKPRSGRPRTAVTPRNEERLDQLIGANWRITIRELCSEPNMETMVATLEYREVCARWVPRMLTQEHKEHRMQICHDLLNQYEAEADSFLDRIITGYETWCHHYEPESKRHLHGVATCGIIFGAILVGSEWNCVPSWSCSKAVSKPVWNIPLLCVQWKTPDDGQRNCLKHVEFHSKNKFEKLVHLVGFIIRTYIGMLAYIPLL